MAFNNGETVRLDQDDVDFGELNPPEKKDNKILWIIVAVVAIIILCCCLVVVFGGVWLWNNGDRLLEEWSVVYTFANLLLT